jgi:hypothetical protein
MTEEQATKAKWTWKTWTVGALVAVSAAATWLLAHIGGEGAPPSISAMPCASSQVVFAQKKRCGFVDLGKLATVEGCLKSTKTHSDGDQSVDVYPDEEFQYLLTYEGRKTRGYLHTEFMPCEREYADVDEQLKKIADHYESEDWDKANCSMRVRVTGRWAYDGVDHRGEWRDQLGNCLNGRGADPAVGWTEIHPAYTAEVLETK